MPWVFDASIAAAWCFEDEQAPETDLLFDRLAFDPATVPSLFPLEIANVLTQALRRKTPRITPEKRAEFLYSLSKRAFTIDRSTNEHAWSDILYLADLYLLSTYDAAYLELAIRHQLELATLDHDLRSAAKKAGITVIP